MNCTDRGDERTVQKQTRCFEIWYKHLSFCWFLCISIILMLSGCTMLGPDFVKPAPPLLDTYTEAKTAGLDSGETDYSKWWRTFEDSVLDNLINKAYRQNLSLQVAGIRIYEARAQLGIVTGNLYPQQQALSGDLTNNKLSTHTDTPYIDNYFNSLSLGFDASWELDFWGKYRRSVQSGIANLEATVASYDNILVSLTAEVARTYIVLRTYEKRLEIAKENIKVQEESLRVAEIRFNEGAVTELDVSQAKMLLGNSRALVPQMESGLSLAKNALAILLGMLPGELNEMLNGPSKIPVALETVIIDIPSNLLRRRPDIRLSELRLAAQSPQIGVAKSGLYPHFFLFGTIGWSATDSSSISDQSSLGDLFSTKSLYWSAGPGFSWDILNYGRIKNKVRVEDARLQQLVVSYKNTVLNAQREVEDAIVTFTRAKEEEQFLRDSVEAAQRSVDISMIQYREGTTDYQRVLDSQGFLASQADRLTSVIGQVSTNLVAAYKALGGGWQIREEGEILSDENKNEMQQRTNWGPLLDSEKLKTQIDEKNRQDWQWPDW